MVLTRDQAKLVQLLKGTGPEGTQGADCVFEVSYDVCLICGVRICNLKALLQNAHSMADTAQKDALLAHNGKNAQDGATNCLDLTGQAGLLRLQITPQNL